MTLLMQKRDIPPDAMPWKPARFLGLLFDDLSITEAADSVRHASVNGRWRYIVTPNAAHLARLQRESASLSAIYDQAWLRLLDSRVIAMTARLLGLTPPHVTPGADLVIEILRRQKDSLQPLCIVGGTHEVIEKLGSRYRLGPIAHINPSIGFWRDAEELEQLAAFVCAAGAPVTFLAVGSPQQEILAHAIAQHGGASGVGICCGAALEFAAGVKRRAPRVLQRLCLEWAYRFCMEPRRMAYRYLVESPPGVFLVFRAAFGR
jgi:exopolysaccharide biosynthesis WecB/TagA/CpsF family protein